MPSAGDKMEMKQPEAAEQLKGLQMEELTAATLPQYEDVIKAMRFDALDTSKDFALQAAREKEVDRLPFTYLREGQYGGLFVMKDGERVVGFVALRIEPDQRLGIIERVWHAEHHHQVNTFSEMLHTSEQYFREHNCDRGIIKASNLSRGLHRVTERSKTERFFTVKDESDENAVLEKAQ